MVKNREKWICPVCNKELYLLPSFLKNKKTCSYTCRNKSSYHRQCNSLSKKGKSIPWNIGIKGYKTSRFGMKHSEETKILMREKHWAKTNPEAHLKRYFSSGINKPTKYENMFAELLRKLKINFISQAVINNKYQVDFLIDKKVIIEIDGNWHYKKKELRLEDKNRDKILIDLGYIVKHIKNNEVIYYE